MAKYIPNFPNYDHQTEALRRSWGCVAFAYLMGTGTGKAKVAIDDACAHYENRLIDALVVFANKGSYRNWPNTEIPKHFPTRIKKAEYTWTGSDTKQKQNEYKYVAMFEGMKILYFNIESLSISNSRAMSLLINFMSQHRCMAIVDESTVIKNMTAVRTKNAIKLARLAAYRRIMTGTPVTKGPLNLFSQFEFLGPAFLGFKSFYSFRARYAVLQQMEMGGRKFDVPVAYKNLDDLSDRVAPFSFRVVKEECLDLPKKIYREHQTFMTDEQQHFYDAMRKESIAQFNDQEFITATEVITIRLRLHQIVCGHLPKEDGTIYDFGNNRVDSLLEQLEEMDGKAVIWANYRPSVTKMVKALKKEYGEGSVVEYHGGVPPDLREQNKLAFMEGKPRWFVGNPAIGGYGLTLTSASDMFYYSNSDNLEHRLQSEDRIHRPGATKTCVYTNITCPDTVDEKILKNLREGHSIAGKINRDNITQWI